MLVSSMIALVFDMAEATLWCHIYDMCVAEIYDGETAQEHPVHFLIIPIEICTLFFVTEVKIVGINAASPRL